MAGVLPIKLNSMTGAAWGQKGTLVLPNGPTYEEIILVTSATPAELERVSVNLNGDEIYILSGQELQMLEAYKRREKTTGVYVIPFSDITARTKNGVRYTALVTELGDNITLDIQFKAKSSATPLSIECWAHVSPAQPMRIVLPRLRKETMQASAVGDNEFTGLLSSPNLVIRRMHFANATIAKLQIHRDFVREYEATKSISDANQKRNERTPQPGYFHFDPIVRGFSIEELFPTTRNSELKFTVTTTEAPGYIPILIESLEVVRPEVFAN